MSQTTISNVTLAAHKNYTVGTTTVVNTLSVPVGFNNIYDYGTIDGFFSSATAAVNVSIEVGGTLTGGTIQNTNGAITLLTDSGTESNVTLGTGAEVRVDTGGLDIGDTVISGGTIDLEDGIGTSIQNSGGIINDFSGTLSLSTIDAGGILNVLGGTASGNIIDFGATEKDESGFDTGSTIMGDATIYSSGTLNPGTLDSAFIDGGTVTVESKGVLSGTLNFSGTGGTIILESGANISAASFGSLENGTIILQNITDSSDSTYAVNTLTDVATFDVSGHIIDLQLTPEDVNDSFTLSATTVAGVISTAITAEYAMCFLPGTQIKTPHGTVAIETLKIGDRVVTAAGKKKPVKWIGKRSYDGRFIAGNHLALPVCFKRDSLRPGVPSRDLYVSPGHGIYMEEQILVPAWRLVNGVSICQAERVDYVDYINIELEDHDVIFAEDCPVETFLNHDVLDFRAQYQNADEYKALYPDETVRERKAVPRLEEGQLLQMIQQRIAALAGIDPAIEYSRETLRGIVEQAGPKIVSGWVQSIQHPETPVKLDIFIGGVRVLRGIPANAYRADLRQKGLGSGCHGFSINLPAGFKGTIEVRRSMNQQALGMMKTDSQAA